MSNHQHTQSAPPRDDAPAYSVPKICRPPDSLAAARAEMNEAEQKYADARARAHIQAPAHRRRA